MALLPSVFILRFGAKYLNLTDKIPASLPSGFLTLDEEQIWSPRVKFAAVPAKTGDGQFVHIRSTYNNKYWVKKQIETESWIVASAKKPEEDTSKDSCTLFEVYSLGDDGPSVALRHVQTQISVGLSSSSDGDAQQGLLLPTISGTIFSVIDRESLVVLPSQIAFKYNDLYMRSIWLEDHEYQRFDSGFDLAHERVAKELIPTADGNYHIKDVHWGKFLTRHGSWVWADSTESTSIDTVFSFVNIDNNVFGARSLGNDRFIGPVTKEGKTNCLSAEYLTLTSPAKLILEERVLKREISNIEYRLSNAIIYEENPMEVDTQTTSNLLTDSETTSTLMFQKTKSRTTSWTNSQSIKLGVSVSMTLGAIPFISEGEEIGLETNISNTYNWGETETKEESTGVSHAVTVPPLKTYMVSLMATAGACEVPFSYTQRDLSTTGEWTTTTKDDGRFTGINNYNFRWDQVETNLDE